jgi:hypothetical protein
VEYGMIYKLEPIWKKSVVDIEHWYRKDNDKKQWIEKESGWRWGSATFNSDEFPDIDLKNDQSFNVLEELDDPELEYDDGCWSSMTFGGDLTEEEQEELEYMDQDELEEKGWHLHYIDTFYTGPLKLTDENVNEWKGDDNG